MQLALGNLGWAESESRDGPRQIKRRRRDHGSLQGEGAAEAEVPPQRTGLVEGSSWMPLTRCPLCRVCHTAGSSEPHSWAGARLSPWVPSSTPSWVLLWGLSSVSTNQGPKGLWENQLFALWEKVSLGEGHYIPNFYYGNIQT